MTATSSPPTPFTIRVPGSTSNLGSGFDFLGLAIDLALEVSVLGFAAGAQHEFESLTGTAVDWPVGEDNVLLRALEVGRADPNARPVRLRVHSEIPIARGFGSSGAATVAGLLLGRALAGKLASEPTLVAQGAQIEAHPDNSTASLLGGCTLAIPENVASGLQTGVSRASELQAWRVLRQEIHPSIGFAIAWPERPLSTAEGRRALPQQVSFADAIENPRRVAALLEGLRSGDGALLALGGEDRLHVRYRLPLIPGGAAALNAAHDAGAWLATISGSGSGLIALAPKPECATVAAAMAAELEAAQENATGRVVRPAMGAPRVESGVPGHAKDRSSSSAG